MKLDPRVNLFVLIITATLVFTLGGLEKGCRLFGIVLLKALLSRQWKLSGVLTIFYAILYCAAVFLPLPVLLAAMIQFFFLRGITLALAFSSFFKGTDIGEMVAALEHAHIPKAITISIAVMLRFVPSIREDYRYIKQGMKTRGIKLGPVQVVTHPGSTYEALIVPLMMRVVRTSSELAASAETRGILYDGPKTYLNPVKMRVLDYIAFAFFAALYIGAAIITIS